MPGLDAASPRGRTPPFWTIGTPCGNMISRAVSGIEMPFASKSRFTSRITDDRTFNQPFLLPSSQK